MADLIWIELPNICLRMGFFWSSKRAKIWQAQERRKDKWNGTQQEVVSFLLLFPPVRQWHAGPGPYFLCELAVSLSSSAFRDIVLTA